MLQAVDWATIMDSFNDDVDRMWNSFYSTTSLVVNLFAPFRFFPSKETTFEPWLTKEVRIAIRNKRKAFRAMKAGSLPREEFKGIRKFTKSLIESSKTAFETHAASEIKHNPRAFWKILKKITKPKSSILPILDSDSGSLPTNPSDTASVFSKFYTQVFVKDDGVIPPCDPTLKSEEL
jgi:hypothetical protein